MTIGDKISRAAEKILFGLACHSCPLQKSCAGACLVNSSENEKEEKGDGRTIPPH